MPDIKPGNISRSVPSSIVSQGQGITPPGGFETLSGPSRVDLPSLATPGAHTPDTVAAKFKEPSRIGETVVTASFSLAV